MIAKSLARDVYVLLALLAGTGLSQLTFEDDFEGISLLSEDW